ncbi:uncharacterized protein LOC113215995 isoform X2 [Frankliniella occidentalis]|uniref:Uncharacterized protein LOC113215995 isoform X2 n=1 Tax=Frankliniella occidentalis TaxID=133901 RepID=A0A9C6TQZ0_FRAOC|nr:uncharacterized protein LOC113215995 isoform X2 [Frankliniella occidentalis]
MSGRAQQAPATGSALRRQSLVDLREDDEVPVTPRSDLRAGGRRRPQRTASVAGPGAGSGTAPGSPFWSQSANTSPCPTAPSTPSGGGSRLMKGRHQFKRRFSLQPSFLKDDGLDDSPRHGHGSSGNSHHADDGEGEVPGVGGAKVRHKVVVLGAAKTGKSSLIAQFLYNTFSPKYKRTVEEMHHGEFSVGGVNLTLDILDTAGSYEFPAMRALCMKSADAIVLVYDVTDADTFEEVRSTRDQVLEAKGGECPIVVVGNKIDLLENKERQVDLQTTETVVTVDWENGFVEASAKDGTNVTQVFKELLSQAKVKYNLSPAMRRRRQSLPPHPAPGMAPAIPSPAQLQHLQQLQERHAGGKRNSCVIS